MNQNKLYVGNLSYQTTDAELNACFGAHGAISDLKIITDRETGRSKGFAFITFESAESAEAALSLDGTELDGRSLKVSLAKEDRNRQQRRPFNRDGGGHRGGERW